MFIFIFLYLNIIDQKPKKKSLLSFDEQINEDSDFWDYNTESEFNNQSKSIKENNSFSSHRGESPDLKCQTNSIEEINECCIICLNPIERISPIWQCQTCFCHLFHLKCIQQWARNLQAKSINGNLTTRLFNNTSEAIADKNSWFCPQCRKAYSFDEIPQFYYCYCGKTKNPPDQKWLKPHACENLCGKALKPDCGHQCVEKCHPNRCAPCPKMTSYKCFCGSNQQMRRCNDKKWSCNQTCNKLLACGKHRCKLICHEGECNQCDQIIMTECLCKKTKKHIPCYLKEFTCENKCGKPYGCEGNHVCEKVCHPDGECGVCPRTLPRQCYCGKESYHLPCNVDVSSCKATCGKILSCGLHTCSRICHPGECDPCVMKVSLRKCRCGKTKKEFPCSKEYLCNIKCTKMRNCKIHKCNQKCCTGDCPPCTKVCGKRLNCTNHQCEWICHQGPCYECTQQMEMKCKCGEIREITVCQPKKPIKHYVTRKCQGNHKEEKVLCSDPFYLECEEKCGALLSCGNHTCQKTCHIITKKNRIVKDSNGLDQIHVEDSEFTYEEINSKYLKQIDIHADQCEQCNKICNRKYPHCGHICKKPCHLNDCPLCIVKCFTDCHCLSERIEYLCFESINKESFEKKRSCGNRCPKTLPKCGHLCKKNCHSGPCTDPCEEKLIVTCKCKNIKKSLSCQEVLKIKGEKKSTSLKLLDCEDNCIDKKEQRKKNTILNKEPITQTIQTVQKRKAKEKIQSKEDAHVGSTTVTTTNLKKSSKWGTQNRIRKALGKNMYILLMISIGCIIVVTIILLLLMNEVKM